MANLPSNNLTYFSQLQSCKVPDQPALESCLCTIIIERQRQKYKSSYSNKHRCMNLGRNWSNLLLHLPATPNLSCTIIKREMVEKLQRDRKCNLTEMVQRILWAFQMQKTCAEHYSFTMGAAPGGLPLSMKAEAVSLFHWWCRLSGLASIVQEDWTSFKKGTLLCFSISKSFDIIDW